jgi:hypothetical protein
MEAWNGAPNTIGIKGGASNALRARLASVTNAAERNAFSVWPRPRLGRASGCNRQQRRRHRSREVEKDLREVHRDDVEAQSCLGRDQREQDLVDAEAERVGERCRSRRSDAERDRLAQHSTFGRPRPSPCDREADQQDRP